MGAVHNCQQIFPLVVLLLAFTTLAAERTYTNEYAVYIPRGKEVADQLAERHGFTNLGQIGELENHFHFEHSGISKRSTLPSTDLHAKLAEEPGVEWIEQQHLKKRVKRDIDVESFTDPLWDEQWYLNGDVDTSMNVNRAWELGYTGDGVVVSILDDGLEIHHPDLINNYDPRASYDVNDQDGDPTPRYDLFNTNQHGTRCAGEVAMEANNGVCGVGVAFNASIGGIRMLDGPITDRVEAISLSIKRWYIDIYSSSWGPEDNGGTVEGPGTLAQAAFRVGIVKGRRGLGSIYVWASGNGGRKDSCSCDGYASSLYTITVSSVKENGKVPFYLEECASIMASTYSSGSRKSRKIVTSDLNGGCSRNFSGTSASAPLAAGICALALEANPRLTWRDLQYIIAMTAKRENLDGSWQVNGAGYHVSHRYGFGLMDAEAMVLLAEEWETLPKQHSCPVFTSHGRRVFFGSTVLSLDVETDGCLDEPNHVQYLEHVQLNITLAAKSRGDISIVLVSPSGTRSTVLPNRVHDRRRGSFDGWLFMSTHFWGERPEGTWELEVHSRSSPTHRGTLKSWSLVLWGTALPPLRTENTASINHHEVVRRDTESSDSDYFESISSFEDMECNEQCVDGCTGTGADECFRCKNYINRENGACVESCPQGYYPPPQTNRRCRKCDKTCKTCRGHTANNCTRCHSGHVLTGDSSCVSESDTSCQGGFYKDSDVCRPCRPYCRQCQSKDVCEECEVGTILSDGVCVYRCDTDQYVDVGDVLSCQPCHPSCLTCVGGGDQDCLVCKGGRYFTIDGKCEGTECGDGYYLDQDENCAECLYACKECENNYTCNKCDEGWIVSAGEPSNSCVFFCEEGTYSDGVRCNRCPDGCAICLLIVDETVPICLDCDDGYQLKGDLCEECTDPEDCECHPTCEQCWGPGISQCSQCREEYYLLDDTCVPFCPSNSYYPDNSTWICGLCEDSCLKCNGSRETDCTACHSGGPSGGETVDGRCPIQESCDHGCSECFKDAPSICTACQDGFFLRFSSCAETCGEGYFGEDGECKPCLATCRTCDTYETCTACNENYLLHDGTCGTSCGEGYHQDGSECRRCSSNCRRCAEERDCHECDGDYYLEDGVCVQDCKPGYTPVGGDCWSCDPSCSQCNGPNENDCTVCKDGSEAIDNRCRDCDMGSYIDPTGECKTCDTACNTCSGPSSSDCLSCGFYFFLTSENTCETSCPDGFYEDFERNICGKCHKSCNTCLDSGPKNCIDCKGDYYLLLTSEQTCVRHCPEGHYKSDDEGFKDCRICSHDCKACSGSYLQCTSCEQGMYLYEDRCISECPDNFDANDKSQRCVPLQCPEHCMEGQCNEWGDCLDCKEGYEEFFGECVEYTTPCNSSQYRRYNDQFKEECAPCSSSCATCLGPGDQDCLECATDHFLSSDGRCVAQCGEGFWHNEKSCLECHPSCNTCDSYSPHDCLSCKEGLQLDSRSQPASQPAKGPCVAGCPPHKFKPEGRNDCVECHTKCGSCNGLSEKNCTYCRDSSYLIDGSCQASCPKEGYYHWHPAGGRDGFECKPCHRSCLSCFDGDQASCTACNDSVRQQHKCQEQCDSGYYEGDNKICQPCHPDCDNCLNSKDCTSCKGDKALYGSKCVKQCPSHYYSTTMYSSHKVCQSCHQDCFDCTGSSVFECTSCYPNYELDDGVCFSKCPRGQYFDGNSTFESCLECHDTCQDCFGPLEDQCIGCFHEEVLQRIDTNHARCTVCCQKDVQDDCCQCSHVDDKKFCPGYKIPQHRRKPPRPSPAGPVVFFCMMVVIAFLVIFGLLQARSNRQLCWRDTYSRLPTYYNGDNQFVKIQTDPEMDLDEGDEGGGDGYFSEDDVYGEMTDDEEEEDY